MAKTRTTRYDVAEHLRTPEEMAADLTQRLIALGQAHEFVRPTLLNERKAANLDQLFAVLLGAYDDKGTIEAGREALDLLG